MDRKPVLIVTCRSGNENWCEEEVGNVLFPQDPEVRIVKTRFSGVLIVFSYLNPLDAYKTALSREYGFVEHIIPVFLSAPLTELDDVIERIREIVNPGERVKLRVRVRGVRGISTTLWHKIRRVLASKNAIHDPSSNTCLFVEVIEDRIYVGKGWCKPSIS
ncbi:MAG: hypothetical protein ABWW65_04420 [Thermoprotei archaeon]